MSQHLDDQPLDADTLEALARIRPPRSKRNAQGGTAEGGAAYMRPKQQPLLHKTLKMIRERPATPEDLQRRLKAAGVFHVITSIRPRMTELHRAGLICDSGERGLGESGKCTAIVWRATTAEEYSEFIARKAAEEEEARSND